MASPLGKLDDRQVHEPHDHASIGGARTLAPDDDLQSFRDQLGR
jgi:hypothetical protein